MGLSFSQTDCCSEYHLRFSSNWPSQLTNIQCLDLASIIYYPSQAGYYTDDLLDWFNLNTVDHPSTEAQKGLLSNIAPLHSLTIRSDTLGALSIGVASALKELELVTADGYIDGLDLVIRHTQALESFSIVGFIGSDIFEILNKGVDTLPQLTSFRLSCEVFDSLVTMSEEHVVALAGFISNHRNLRRLYLRIAGAKWDVLRNLIPCIQKLPHLSVLGLHLGRVFLSPADAKEVTTLLGDKLTALHLTLPWTYPSSADVNVNALIPLVSTRLLSSPLT